MNEYGCPVPAAGLRGILAFIPRLVSEIIPVMRISRWLRAGVAVWLWSWVTTLALAGSVHPLLVAPDSVAAGATGHVLVVILNSGDGPMTYAFPAEFPGTLTVRGVSQEVTLRRAADQAAEAQIASGAFARRKYEFSLPANPGASVELALAEGAGQRVTLALGDGVRIAGEPETLAGTTPSSGGEIPTEGSSATPKAPKPPKSESVALEFFRNHFFPHEPMYVIMGWEDPNVKFQLSFKYRMLNSDPDEPGWLVHKAPALTNLYFAYTQTSLWDTAAESSPFYDTNYKPELFYQWQRVDRQRWADWFAMDLQGGMQHASNGQDGADSRSMNVVYIMPTFYFGDIKDFHFRIAPRVFGYLGDMEDNPDIADYYGHVQLRTMLGWADGLQLAVIGNIGDGFNHGSAQFDLTYPLYRFGGRSMSVYLDLQYFTGYGETLLDYNQRSSAFRAGFSLWR